MTADENKVDYTDYKSPMATVYKYCPLQSHQKVNLNVIMSLLMFCL